MENNNVSRRDEQAALQFAKNLSKYPTEVAVGVGIIIPNFVNGCCWGFVPDNNEEYTKCMQNITSNKYMSSIKVRGGYLVYMNMEYLVGVLKDTAMGYLTVKDLEYAQKHRVEAIKNVEKLLSKGYSGRVGIYNLNDTDSITVKGKRYPAFCVTLPDLIIICQRMGYGFKLGDKVRTPGEVNAVMNKVVENLEIAPSSNALFIDIARM